MLPYKNPHICKTGTRHRRGGDAGGYVGDTPLYSTHICPCIAHIKRESISPQRVLYFRKQKEPHTCAKRSDKSQSTKAQCRVGRQTPRSIDLRASYHNPTHRAVCIHKTALYFSKTQKAELVIRDDMSVKEPCIAHTHKEPYAWVNEGKKGAKHKTPSLSSKSSPCL